MDYHSLLASVTSRTPQYSPSASYGVFASRILLSGGANVHQSVGTTRLGIGLGFHARQANLNTAIELFQRTNNVPHMDRPGILTGMFWYPSLSAHRDWQEALSTSAEDDTTCG